MSLLIENFEQPPTAYVIKSKLFCRVLWHSSVPVSSFSVHTIALFNQAGLSIILGLRWSSQHILDCARMHAHVFVHLIPFAPPDFYKQVSNSLPAFRCWGELDESNLSCLIITQF